MQAMPKITIMHLPACGENPEQWVIDAYRDDGRMACPTYREYSLEAVEIRVGRILNYRGMVGAEFEWTVKPQISDYRLAKAAEYFAKRHAERNAK